MSNLFDEILDTPLTARDRFADEADELVAYLSVISPEEAARKAIDFNRRARAAGIPFHMHYDGGLWVCGDEAGDFPYDDIGIPITKRLRFVTKNTSNAAPTMPGFTGEKTDAAGRTYLWSQGHRVAKPKQPMQSPFSRPKRQTAADRTEAHHRMWADVVGGHRNRPLHEEPAIQNLAKVSKRATDAWTDLDFLGPLAPAARGLRFMLNIAGETASIAVKGIAKEHGLEEKHVKRVSDICGYIDLATSLTGLSSLPIGSIGYIVISTARHPVKTLRAAKNGVRHFLAEFHRAHSSEMGGLQMQKALDSAIIKTLLERSQNVSDFDFWTACFMEAMDHTEGNVKQAIEIADGASKKGGKIEKSFDPSKHPRGDGGKFAESGVVSDHKGHAVEYHSNPSHQKILRLLKQSEFGTLRGLAKGKDVIVWDADTIMHDNMANQIGEKGADKFLLTRSRSGDEFKIEGQGKAEWMKNHPFLEGATFGTSPDEDWDEGDDGDGLAGNATLKIRKNLKGSKARVSKAKPKGMHSPFKQKRHEGEVWQGPSGKWFTLKNGRSVPAKDPSGKAKPAKKPKAPKVAATPAHNDGDTWESGGRWFKRAGGKTVRIPKPAPSTPVEEIVESLPEFPAVAPASRNNPHLDLADKFAEKFRSGENVTAKDVFAAADDSHGGTRAEGKYQQSEAYDSLEAGLNKAIAGTTDPRVELAEAKETAKALDARVNQLPTQTNRTGTKNTMQQFSTPPHYSYAVAWVANLTPGDVVLEPSAGTGSLAIHAKNAGAEVHGNEMDPRRADFLKDILGEANVTLENAEQIGATLHGKLAPSVVLMNPPFSATAGRLGDKKDVMVASKHISEALSLLKPGGRLVAIVGEGMKPEAMRYRKWFEGIKAQYDLKANIGVSGDVYTKYGTKFGTRVLVIDKVQSGTNNTVTGDVENIPDLLEKLNGVRHDRPQIAGLAPDLGTGGGSPEGLTLPSGSDVDPAGPVPSGLVLPSTSRRRRVRVPAVAGATADDNAAGRGTDVAGAVAGRPAAGAGGKPGGRVGSSGRGTGRNGKRDAAAAERAGGGADSGGQPAGQPDASGSPLRSPRPVTFVKNPHLQYDAKGEPFTGVITDASGRKQTYVNGHHVANADDPEAGPALYETYHPSKVHIEGAQEHRFPLVESAAMAAVAAPNPTYHPTLSPDLITRGDLSEAQLEAIVYAGQAHQQFLGASDGDVVAGRPFMDKAGKVYTLQKYGDEYRLVPDKRTTEPNNENFASLEAAEKYLVGNGWITADGSKIRSAGDVYRRGYFVGDGCVAAGTRIYDPLTKTHTPIEELVAAGKPITVLSLTKDGLQPTAAECPFRKGVAKLYRVVLDDGREITVTGQHRFKSPDGWMKIDEGLSVGAHIGSSEGISAFAHGADPDTHWNAWRRIQSITFVREDEFFDMYVPGPQNYVAEGFINHNTGVGKGRELAGVILDNQNQGRTKHLWVSQKWPLMGDAQRDVKALGMDPDSVFEAGDLKKEKSPKDGICFVTYSTLSKGPTDKTKESNLDRIVKWLGPDFDGVIAFDESHTMGNALSSKGSRGLKDASKVALTGVELQKRLPNARVVYASATGATEVSNLAYADRLGIWGKGTAFPTKQAFIASFATQGLTGMEAVAQSMKAMGMYGARSLSYGSDLPEGDPQKVGYDRITHHLTDDQKAQYDAAAEGWQNVMENIDKVVKITEGGDTAKNAAMSVFWGAQLRFFDSVLTSMQTPSVIARIRDDLANGRSAVVQLTGTGEAATTKAIAKRKADHLGEDEDEIPDLDVSPKAILTEYLIKSFPVDRYEEYADGDTIKKRKVMTFTSPPEGIVLGDRAYKAGETIPRAHFDGAKQEERDLIIQTPVEDPQAVAIRNELIAKVNDMRIPATPIDQIINAFGKDAVAEVTGRTIRVIDGKEERRNSEAANEDEPRAFQDGRKHILIFSGAGGTGRSYHADRNAKNQEKRMHYLLQPGWRADAAMQGFGRTHRTNQKQAPTLHLVQIDEVPSQKRFISTIARRLDQLGALTKGQSKAGGGGLFSAADNLESPQARTAMVAFFTDLKQQKMPALPYEHTMKMLGIKIPDPNKPNRGQNDGMPEKTTQFLNRMLSLPLGMQHQVFGEFAGRLDQAVKQAIAAGTLDEGVSDFKALKVTPKSETVIYKDPASGAEAKHLVATATMKTHRRAFEDNEKGVKPIGFLMNKASGKVWAYSPGTPTTKENGDVIPNYWLVGPTGGQTVPQYAVDSNYGSNWRKIDDYRQAKEHWDKQYAELPATYDEDVHFVSGATLPVWDRLPGTAKVNRVKLSDGTNVVGRRIDDKDLEGFHAKFGVVSEAKVHTPDKLHAGLMEGNISRVKLANGWILKPARLQNERQIEIEGAPRSSFPQLEEAGAMRVNVAYHDRMFVPSGPAGVRVLERITANNPVSSVQAKEGAASSPRFEPVHEEPAAPIIAPEPPKPVAPASPPALPPKSSAKEAEYKGRTYRVLYSGKTKFGHRTRLEFTDGSKDFWVDTSKVRMKRLRVAKRLPGFGLRSPLTIR